ncbi:MAG: AlpA family phage regulatory protein [Betaproteobacteria bacterium]
MLRLKQVMERTGLARSTIYDKMNPKSPRHDPIFPKQVNLGLGSVGWLESAISTWINGRK